MEMFFLSYVNETMFLLWNLPFFKLVPPKTDGSWWRVLMKCGPLEKGMANHFSVLALRTP